MASSRFVRASRFRHVFAETVKPELHYSDLDLSPVTGDHNYVKGNSKYFSIATRGGGGPVQVIPYSAVGKLPRGFPTLNGHSAAVYDTAWNPFNDGILATGSDDTTVKLWSIPDGGLTESLRESAQTLSGHGKPVALLQWHPLASNVLASAGKDPSVKLWDVEKGTAHATLEGFGGLVQDLAFSYDGKLLLTSTKDKLAKVHDPRAATSVVSEWTPHEGGKAFKALFLGDRGQIFTVGFTKQSKREFKLWDVKNTAEPLTTVEIDQAAGVMMPFYDDDTRMLYLTGKGDGNIRYYEFVDEAPYVYPLAEHRTNVSTRGCDMLPKTACNVMKCEIARFIKLTGDTVEPISFIVPRKSESFQDDIFPDTAAGVPSMTAEAWFGGANVPGKKVSLDPAKGGAAGAASAAPAAFKPTAAPAPAAAASGGAGTAASSSAAAASSSSGAAARTATPAAAAHHDDAEVEALRAKVASLTAALEEAHAKVSELEASEAKLKKALAALSA